MQELEVGGDPAQGRISLAGRLDERADLAAVAARIPQGATVTIDLADLRHINSIGVRAWIGFLRQLRDRGAAIELLRCSQTMVTQMNMIVEAKGGATIVSFYAPYECTSCERGDTRLIDCARDRETLATGALPPMTCSACEGAMAFAELPERYLVFLE